MKPKQQIAIIGLAFDLPNIKNWQEAITAFSEGKVCIGDLSAVRKKDVFGRFGQFDIKPSGYLERIDLFDTAFFGLTNNEAVKMSPEERLFLLNTLKSTYDAGYTQEDLKSSNTGVFYTLTNSMYPAFFDEELGLSEQTPGIEGTRVANFLDLRGPVVAYNTTCSSSLTAMHAACNSLRLEECDMAIVGGVRLGVNEKTGMDRLVIASKKDACRPFDAEADGTLTGEGAISILIKRLEDAQRDHDPIYAIVEGSAMNHGGARTSSLIAPSTEAQKEVIQKAWTNAQVNPEDIRFIEAHGTGTILGDPIEYRGILEAFAESGTDNFDCAISSMKGHIGHLDTLSGLAGMLRLIVGINSASLFPQASFKTMNKHIQADTRLKVLTKPQNWELKGQANYGGVSSFGLTGTNVHMVLSTGRNAGDIPTNEELGEARYFMQLSGNSQANLQAQKNSIIAFLHANPTIDLRDFSNYVNRRFLKGEFNEAYSFSKAEELIEKINSNVQKQEVTEQFYVLNLSILNYTSDEIEESLAENKRLTDLWNQLGHADKVIHAIEDNALRSVLFQYLLCAYIKKYIGEKAVFISRNDENTVQLLLEGKQSVEEIIANPSKIKQSVSQFNTTAFLAHLQQVKAKVSTVVFDTELGLDKILTTYIQAVIDARFDRTNRMRFYEQAFPINQKILKPHNAVKQFQFAFPYFNLQRFWPEYDDITLLQEVTESEEKISVPTKVWSKSEIAAELGDVWKDFLELEELPNDEDDFFDLGGTSLSGLDVLGELEKEVGVLVSYQDMFTYSVFGEMVTHIHERLNEANTTGQVAADTITLNHEQRETDYENYLKEIESSPEEQHYTMRTVLVTGATGYLGYHVVNELAKKEDCKIYCLVRGKDVADASARFTEGYQFYFNHLPEANISVIQGDIERKGLGISAERDKELAEVDTLFHVAGSVSHYGKYERAFSINTTGTINAFDWAETKGVKVFNHSSTYAISEGKIPGVEEATFYETDFDLGQVFSGLIYAETKFKAEAYIRSKSTDMQLNIFRFGNIGGRITDGRFQKNIDTNNVYLLLKTLITLGKYADGISEFSFDFIPVDLTARAMIKLASNKYHENKTFHLLDNERYYLPEICTALAAFDVAIDKVTDEDLLSHFETISQSQEYGSELATLGILRFSSLNQTEENLLTQFDFRKEATDAELIKQGKAIDYNRKEYLHKIIEHGFNCGFLAQFATKQERLENE